MRKLVFFLCLVAGLPVCSLPDLQAQQKNISKEKCHWGTPQKQDTGAGYAQVVKVSNVLYLSGAVAREVTPDGITQLYQGLERSLNSFGATFQNVVKENLYTTDMEAMKKYNASRKIFYKGDFPAATWMQVSRLYMHDARLEVELIAYLPDGD
jgi:2-iminobutanoate/2-iminopropanoate deaminase